MPPKRKPSKKAGGIPKKKRKINATEPRDAGVIRQGNGNNNISLENIWGLKTPLLRPSPGQVGAILQTPHASTSAMPDVVWCADDDITAHIPNQLREKIWGHQYVNLVLLLKGSAELTDFYTASNLVLNEYGCLESRPKVLKDKIPSIEKWTDAFLLFTNIYLRRYPERAVELTQYMSVIRDAAARSPGFGWRAYDEQFRLRQAIQYQSWATLNYPLWLRLLSVPRNSDKVGSNGNSQKGLSPSTVSSYLAAISHVHKVYKWTNPKSQYLVQKAVTGLRRIRQVRDSRAPVTEDMLHNNYHILETVCWSGYELWLFRSAYCFAFYGLLRVSELVYTTADMAHRPLFYSDIKVSTSGSKVGLLVKIRFSKTDQQGRSITLRIPVITGKSVCPVLSIKKFLSVRNRSDGILFIHEDGSPLTHVWILGSSIIYWACRMANRLLSRHLRLEHLGVHISWFGKRGMIREDVLLPVSQKLTYLPPPKSHSSRLLVVVVNYFVKALLRLDPRGRNLAMDVSWEVQGQNVSCLFIKFSSDKKAIQTQLDTTMDIKAISVFKYHYLSLNIHVCQLHSGFDMDY
ncbi:hypothetical protein KUTeg_005677 [Tegillarca granosa]|uniref:Uncharacterized protein n=1 Tax=Tegillarca granosa TaxID=220873 RepID=A0ABQ9FHD6_TEGGR|nr:hypothetical protein KUTeg_005677 [Tegillarca granosa]